MIQAYFSDIKNVILDAIRNSQKNISIAVAWFTQRDLFNEIINSLDRGVNVSVILINDIINRSEHGLDFSLYIQKGGKMCFVDSRKTLMHNKFSLFDEYILITGSYNWTYAAEQRNAENVILTDEINVCSAYANYFKHLWSGLSEITEFHHLKVSDIEANDFLQEYEELVEEYQSMENNNIPVLESLKNIYDFKSNIAVTKLGTVMTQENRHNPILKLNIGMRCRIDNIDNRTLNIIKQGQTLPYTNTVDTCTAMDYQTNVVCDILLGNDDDADKNKSLLKIQLDNLPKLKAGQVKLKTKVTIGTDGCIYVKYVCTNSGLSGESKAVYPDMIKY